MSESSFDPASTVRFDLSSGAVSLDGEGRVVLLPEDVLGALVRGAGAAAPEALRALGESLGASARRHLAADAGPEAALQVVSTHVGRLGFGRLSMEFWGPTLCLKLDDAPGALAPEAREALLEGLVSSLTERDVALLHVEGRYLVLAPSQRALLSARAKGVKGVHELVGMLVEGGAA